MAPGTGYNHEYFTKTCSQLRMRAPQGGAVGVHLTSYSTPMVEGTLPLQQYYSSTTAALLFAVYDSNITTPCVNHSVE